MNSLESKTVGSEVYRDTVVQGDCIEIMGQFHSRSVDFVLTDPPYLAHYCSRDGLRQEWWGTGIAGNGGANRFAARKKYAWGYDHRWQFESWRFN